MPYLLVVAGIILLTRSAMSLSNIEDPFDLKIGVVVETEKEKNYTLEVKQNINNQPGVKVKLDPVFLINLTNPIRSVLDICKEMVSERISALVWTQPAADPLIVPTVSYTLSFYNIPIISTLSRDTIFDDKSVHKTFLRTVPSQSEEVSVIVDLIRHFNFDEIVLLVCNDANGRKVQSEFMEKCFNWSIGIPYIINYDPLTNENRMFISWNLNVTLHQGVKVVVLQGSYANVRAILSLATSLNLLKSYVWFVTENVLDGDLSLDSLPNGLIIPVLMHGKNFTYHIKDVLDILQKGYTVYVDEYKLNSIAPTKCGNETSVWKTGYHFYEALLNTTLYQEKSESLAFDKNGNRLFGKYIIRNLQRSGSNTVLKEIGLWENEFHPNENADIIWPGGLLEKPLGKDISNHLRVITKVTEPFVMSKPAVNEQCKGVVADYDAVICDLPPYLPHNRTKTTYYCCYGYCIDLLIKLSMKLNVTYNLSLAADGIVGQYNVTKRKWNGMIGDLIAQKADILVGALTINNERAQHIDFSNPFKHQGLSILTKKKAANSSLTSFIQPFETHLWILIAVSVSVVSIVLYLLDRFSPFGRFKVTKAGIEEGKVLTLAEAMWFAWGVLLNSGIGDGTPRSFSARVLGIVWAGFSMIIVASYTANLAAFLVLDRPDTEVVGINDARMRNPSPSYKYGTVKDSIVESYFRKKVELTNMYHFMKDYNKDTAAEAIQAVLDHELDAFIWDSAVLSYETARNCELTTVGELFHRSGYGIGLQKNSPWKERISLEVLRFHEDGEIERLDTRYMESVQCSASSAQPATLGLRNMAGVFMLVGSGIGLGIILTCFEVFYKRKLTNRREEEMAKKALDKWRVQSTNKDHQNHNKKKPRVSGQRHFAIKHRHPENNFSPKSQNSVSNLTDSRPHSRSDSLASSQTPSTSLNLKLFDPQYVKRHSTAGKASNSAGKSFRNY